MPSTRQRTPHSAANHTCQTSAQPNQHLPCVQTCHTNRGELQHPAASATDCCSSPAQGPSISCCSCSLPLCLMRCSSSHHKPALLHERQHPLLLWLSCTCSRAMRGKSTWQRNAMQRSALQCNSTPTSLTPWTAQTALQQQRQVVCLQQRLHCPAGCCCCCRCLELLLAWQPPEPLHPS